MKGSRLWGILTAFAIAGTTFGYFIGRARAAVPTTQVLTYSAVITDTAGTPLNGMNNIQLQVWDMQTAGTLKCTYGPQSFDLTAGAFQAELPAGCVTAVHQSGDLWVEIIVNGSSLGRAKLGAVPYTLEADHATLAETANAAAGPLKTTIAGLSGPMTAIRVMDTRATACPPSAPADTDLIVAPFTLTKSAQVRIGGDMIRNAVGRADLYLVLDGQTVHRTITFTPTAQWTSGHVEWTGTLPAGAHSASLRGSTANSWGCTDGTPYGELSVIYQ